jgi:ABC-2 type transport system ATP-binding protein
MRCARQSQAHNSQQLPPRVEALEALSLRGRTASFRPFPNIISTRDGQTSRNAPKLLKTNSRVPIYPRRISFAECSPPSGAPAGAEAPGPRPQMPEPSPIDPPRALRIEHCNNAGIDFRLTAAQKLLCTVMNPQALAIEIVGLTKDYPVGFWRKRMRRSLDNLSLRVEDGEVFGFLGPNGAGKTTTLKLLMGLIFPTAGSARILGRPIDDVGMHRDIGYLPEQPYFYDYLTARELLDYYARFSGYSSAERRARVTRVLDRVGLSSAADVQLRKFSKGMLQRAGIAQAIIHDPRIVFLDEPMSGLDPIGRREVRDIILDLKTQGRTVFFSTHILSDAEMLCDRVAVLHQGKLRGVGAPGKIVSVEVHGMEILFEPAEDHPLSSSLAQRATPVGGRYRVEVPEAELYRTLDDLRACSARILSVSPVRPTLEDYFLGLVERNPDSPAPVEAHVP